jgi:hypothetical protein
MKFGSKAGRQPNKQFNPTMRAAKLGPEAKAAPIGVWFLGVPPRQGRRAVDIGPTGRNRATSRFVDLAWWLGLGGFTAVLLGFALIALHPVTALLNPASYIALVAVAVFLAGWVLGLVEAARRQAWGWFVACLLLFWPVLVFLFMQKHRRDPIAMCQDNHMKIIFAVLGAVLLLAGCAGGSPKPVGSLRAGTFTTEKYAFSVSYDRNVFTATERSGTYTADVPGLGKVTDPQLTLTLIQRHVPTALAVRLRVSSMDVRMQLEPPPMAERIRNMEASLSKSGLPFDAVKPATLDGMPAVFFTAHRHGGRYVFYGVSNDHFSYSITVAAPLRSWSKDLPMINAVVESFAVPQ